MIFFSSSFLLFHLKLKQNFAIISQKIEFLSEARLNNSAFLISFYTLTSFQHHFKHHFNILSTSFQHYFNTLHEINFKFSKSLVINFKFQYPTILFRFITSFHIINNFIFSWHQISWNACMWSIFVNVYILRRSCGWNNEIVGSFWKKTYKMRQLFDYYFVNLKLKLCWICWNNIFLQFLGRKDQKIISFYTFTSF
jgi:hypothetical protein